MLSPTHQEWTKSGAHSSRINVLREFLSDFIHTPGDLRDNALR